MQLKWFIAEGWPAFINSLMELAILATEVEKPHSSSSTALRKHGEK